MKQRDEFGRFKRIHHEWSLENFDDGYIVNLRGKKRFRVYKPEHPRADHMGYIFRSIIAYETYHGVTVPLDMETHHIDGNTLNDKKENLVLLTNSEHRIIHAIKRGSLIKHVCKHCGKEFYIQRFRLNDLSGRNRRRGIFCSLDCFHKHERTDEHKKNISNGLKRAYKEGKRK